MAEILFRFPGVELYLRVNCTDFFIRSVFSKISLLEISIPKLEVSLLGRINLGGTLPCALKFEHAVLVDTCDVFLKISEALSR